MLIWNENERITFIEIKKLNNIIHLQLFMNLLIILSFLFSIGALICGMEKTVKGILENFLYLIRRFGYVPYGNRLYYEGRSQPPLLTQMMASYYTYTNDQSFIIDNIQVHVGFKIKEADIYQ